MADTVACSPNRQQKLDCIQFLIQQGADVNAKGYNGRTALSGVVSIGYPCNEMVARLLIENGADVDVRDDNQQPIIQNIVANKWYDVLGVLLERGVTP